ncbi:hypothetical protein ACG33_11240 [Steroidobacter denitrificans]|uniref:Uncharacterized protein n=1 Tax=Steroidobacter denitrificans TaxID=465721 RepID=A0A127FB65_STEDE|nr:hypothetical protein [Steroidobacter denitrificans]AMN47664.1 hypothetical protein ACG33_11240 [Steroidobacter denitrificans]
MDSFLRRLSRPAARGFTVAEGLAALLVVAVGILGIAALYSDQVPRKGARWRQEAAELVDIIAERILATREGREGFSTTIGVVCGPEDRYREGLAPGRQVSPQGDGRPRLAIDVAALVAACWEDEVARKLPSSQGKIRRDLSTIPVSYVISVSWSSLEGTASYVMRVSPPG